MLSNMGDMPDRLVTADDPPSIIVNRDLVSQVLIGTSPSVVGGNINVTSIIDPLGSIAVDGKTDIYGIRVPGDANHPTVDVMPGVTQWLASPAQIASQITASGISLLSNPKSLANNGKVTRTITPAGLTLGPFPINQISYELLLQIQNTVNPANIVNCELTWSDSVSGLVVSDENYLFYAGGIGVGTAHNLRLHGPTKGDTLSVFLAPVTVNNIVAAYSLSQISRSFARDIMETITPQTVIPGWFQSIPPMDPSGKFLASIQQSFTANQNVTFILPMYTGTIEVNYHSTSISAGHMEVRIASPTEVTFPSTIFALGSSGSSGFAPWGTGSGRLEVAMPRQQCTLQLLNVDAAAQTLTCTVIAKELATV